MMLSLDLAGAVVNQPPTADAGDDQTVECPNPAVLDASSSSDLDGNLALFSWRRGGRSGPEVGFDEIVQVQQALGRQSYVLRIIDAFAQTDEDTTMVTVVDRRPPVLSCSLTVPVIDQTNHSMVDVGLMARAGDACDGPLPVRVSVFADEDAESPTGQRNSSPAAVRVGPGTLRLRAERHVTANWSWSTRSIPPTTAASTVAPPSSRTRRTWTRCGRCRPEPRRRLTAWQTAAPRQPDTSRPAIGRSPAASRDRVVERRCGRTGDRLRCARPGAMRACAPRRGLRQSGRQAEVRQDRAVEG